MNLQLNQDILYFAANGVDSYGNRAFKEPTQIKGRWENKNNVVTLRNGSEVVSTVTVWTIEKLKRGSQLFFGRRRELEPHELENPNQIGLKVEESSPMYLLNGVETGHKAYLTNLGNNVYT